MPITVNIFLLGVKKCLVHISQIPLNGIKCSEMGMELTRDCASNWKRNATELLDFGDKEPSNS